VHIVFVNTYLFLITPTYFGPEHHHQGAVLMRTLQPIEKPVEYTCRCCTLKDYNIKISYNSQLMHFLSCCLITIVA